MVGIPDDSVITASIDNAKINNREVKYILYLIETNLRSDKNSTNLFGFKSYSVEHLLPKGWRTEWTDLSNEEDYLTRDKKLLTLGNLAIISQKLNSSISNSCWNVKLKGKGKSEGLRMLGTGIMTHQDVLNKSIWNEAEIENRAKYLSEKINEIWKF